MEACATWGAVPPPRAHVGRNPLDRAPGSTLGHPSGEAREAGLPTDLVPNTVSGAHGRLLSQAILSQAIGKLTPGHPLVSWNPQESDLVGSGDEPCADLIEWYSLFVCNQLYFTCCTQA